ncbi:unnamed protein product [Rangifer tarandus platyrhynchus]|uniref:Secreted protein n=2 Tax=Rangifer tarandus platyrhynchus TaxID=3082113 RepID=A0ABN8YFA6_RANTA|nr:unnamed protein product [Rangifer tarandus platyrhynchus]
MKSQSLCFIILVICPPYAFIGVSVLEAHLGDSTLENPNLSSEVLRMRAEPPPAMLPTKGHPAQRIWNQPSTFTKHLPKRFFSVEPWVNFSLLWCFQGNKGS